MTWADVLSSRVPVLLSAMVSLMFGYWYLKGWFWLPKPSPRRLGGLALMAILGVCIPVSLYRASAGGGHRDFVARVIVIHCVVLMAMFLYQAKRKSAAESRSKMPHSGR
jgi:hypothetical protein